MEKLDVVALGTLAVDYYALVNRLCKKEEKTKALDYKIYPGGVSGNVLTQTSLLGLKSGWVGKIGDDSSGKILLDEFKKNNIDYSHAEIMKGKNSMFTWINVDKSGDRSIVMFPNVLTELTVEDLRSKHREYIQSCRVLQIEACLLPLSLMLESAKIAKEVGVKVVFDLDVPPSEIESSKMGTLEELYQILSLTDVLIPCKSAAKELINSENFIEEGKNLLKYGPTTIAITLEKQGCLVLNKDEQYVVGRVEVDKVVDTTGAGDSFHGGMIYSILNNYSLKEAGLFSNACGAFCCTNLGARAMGNIHQIKDLIRKQKRE